MSIHESSHPGGCPSSSPSPPFVTCVQRTFELNKLRRLRKSHLLCCWMALLPCPMASKHPVHTSVRPLTLIVLWNCVKEFKLLQECQRHHWRNGNDIGCQSLHWWDQTWLTGGTLTKLLQCCGWAFPGPMQPSLLGQAICIGQGGELFDRTKWLAQKHRQC